MRNILELNADREARQRATRIVLAMEDLFNVPQPGLTMVRSKRGIVAKYAAVAAIMAAEDCGRDTAEQLLGVETRSDRSLESLDHAHVFAGMVTVESVWETVYLLTGVTKERVLAGGRRSNVLAARFLSRVLLSRLVGMSGTEVAAESGNKAGHNKPVSESVRGKTVMVLAEACGEDR